jgi:hypothetical protein
MPIARSAKQEFSSGKFSVFTKEGRLLWISPAWLQGVQGDERSAEAARRIGGFGWLEFVLPSDYERVCEWWGRPEEHAISFCAVAPEHGKTVRLAWAKVEYGDRWLVAGDFVDCIACFQCSGYAMLPAPPCVIADAEDGPASSADEKRDGADSRHPFAQRS